MILLSVFSVPLVYDADDRPVASLRSGDVGGGRNVIH